MARGFSDTVGPEIPCAREAQVGADSADVEPKTEQKCRPAGTKGAKSLGNRLTKQGRNHPNMSLTRMVCCLERKRHGKSRYAARRS